ncbi:MAG: hypothetical protein LBR27_12090 [Bifidobacteriaceae bacterium]|nr:hypothetical protein [Bifidobacteriaceae bacterium]
MAEHPSQRLDTRDELHVYEATRHGLPNIPQYFRELMGRWPFAAEFSRSSIRAANTDTVFGQLWLILNPLLLAVVYFILIVILTGTPISRGGPTLALICCGLFLYTLLQGAVSSGAGSVTGGGALISRMAFPRLLMPFAAVRTNFFRFLPTVPVFLLMKLILGGEYKLNLNGVETVVQEAWGWEMLLSIYFLALMVVFSAGLAAFMATLQVYFRDTASFLPYFLRIWMYLSPVLWPAIKFGPGDSLYHVMLINPMYSICGGWSDTLLLSTVPPLLVWVVGTAWALVMLVVGSLFFMSRERDFAVRI